MIKGKKKEDDDDEAVVLPPPKSTVDERKGKKGGYWPVEGIGEMMCKEHGNERMYCSQARFKHSRYKLPL